MKNKISRLMKTLYNKKKILGVILVIFVMLFTITRTTTYKKFISSINKKEVKEENILEPDNWELSTVFYDSTVDNGTTPLTEINWDASDGGYGVGTERIITIQINYKNTNCQNNYAKNDLNIRIERLIGEDTNLDIQTTIGANNSEHAGYDWNVTYNYDAKQYIFSNNVEFIKNTNFEGSIRIVYVITPKSESPEKYEDECIHTLNKDLNAVLVTSKTQEYISFRNYNGTTINVDNNNHDYYIVQFGNCSLYSGENEITIESQEGISRITCDTDGSCSLSGKNYIASKFLKIYNTKFENPSYIYGYIYCYDTLAKADKLSFSYQRTYKHRWAKYNYKLTKTANKISILDGIDNAENYIWVNYNFSFYDYPYGESYEMSLYSKTGAPFYIYDELPSDVIVYSKGHLITPYENNKYRLEVEGRKPNVWGNYYLKLMSTDICVGYPKSIYNESNMNITNEAELYVRYASDDDYSLQSTATINIDLNDFTEYNTDNLYYTKKESSAWNPYNISNCAGCNSSRKYYQSIVNDDPSLTGKNRFSFRMEDKAYYTGKPLTVKIGDDYLIAETSRNHYDRVNDNEFFFNKLEIDYINNGYGESILNKYNWKLYVRRANSSNYELYKENIGTGIITFSDEDEIVAYYLYANNLTDSVVVRTYNNLKLFKQDIDYNGSLFNFNYLEVYTKDSNNNLVLQNPSDVSQYDSFYYGKDDLIAYDLENHGGYIDRSRGTGSWEYFKITQPKVNVEISKNVDGGINQDENNQKFKIKYNVYSRLLTEVSDEYGFNEYHKQDYNDSSRYSGYYLYDLLPEGMKISSSKEEIYNSIYSNIIYGNVSSIYNNNFEQLASKEEFISNILLPNFTMNDIEIINNWNNTNRTLLKINFNFGNNKFSLFSKNSNFSSIGFNFYYNTEISYDDFYEYGNVYENIIYMKNIDGEVLKYKNSKKDTNDLNENNDTNEDMATGTVTSRIQSAVSTHQDVQVSVQSDKSNYDTGKVESSLDSDYSYKLRVRTGTNDVTNLVIYDSLEDYAKDPNLELVKANGGRKSWSGEFLGIDTTYAESKGYTVKAYYSEEETPGSLGTDNSWHEYNDTIDKTKVKSLAFEYLDDLGNKAVLPANSLTYVLIRMKSPSEDLKTFAYNGCWTEWNAIDSVTGTPVDFITGINSNIVRVSLPNSVEPVDITINIDKYWEDNSNEKTTRPETVTVKLLPNGNVSEAIEIPLGQTNIDSNNTNHWYTSVEVPKYDEDGDEITYTLSEDLIEKDDYVYVPSINNYTITNTLNKKINIKKNWLDNHNSYLTRPSNVVIKVKQNNSNYSDVTITGNYSTDTWSKEIKVPVYSNSNQEYTYTLEEVGVNDYTSSYDEETNTFTNLLSKNKNITISKEWIDKNNTYNTRPSNITIHLKRNGENYQDIVLNGNSNTWNSSSISVPVYDNNGIKYTYTISEDNITNYGKVEYNQEDLKVTNTLKTNKILTIKKSWIDNHNEYNTRPSNIKIKVLRNNENYQEVTLSGEEDIWTTSIEVPKYDNNQTEYTYTIKENNEDIVLEYSDVEYDDYTVINKLNKKKDIEVKKIWNDSNNKYLTRPEELKIILYQNDNIYRNLVLSGEGNTWGEIIEDVPVYDNNGVKYTYRIEEESIDSRYGEITYDQSNLTVENKLTEIPKVTLYFTVKNGYIPYGGKDILYDEEGYNNILSKYNIDTSKEYIYEFSLKNEETGEIYKGKLSTQGILQFEDMPYGTYRAVEEKDEYFDFVSMLSIEDVEGVAFIQDDRGGVIEITPTGKNIIYGANIINKIEVLINPKTGSNIIKILLFVIVVGVGYYLYRKRRTIK